MVWIYFLSLDEKTHKSLSVLPSWSLNALKQGNTSLDLLAGTGMDTFPDLPPFSLPTIRPTTTLSQNTLGSRLRHPRLGRAQVGTGFPPIIFSPYPWPVTPGDLHKRSCWGSCLHIIWSSLGFSPLRHSYTSKRAVSCQEGWQGPGHSRPPT